ncbi:MAG: hypothetical protein LQ352_002229 [Teloschistes flavicans]|nr:MAG: hypothetical protein LQ352_002229 [Teloschistes flavicans]
MTIKAFLKKLIAEREKAQKKDKALTIPAAVQADEASKDGASHNVPANEVHHSSDAAEVFRETSAKPTTDLAKPAKENGTLPTESQKDVPQQSIEATEDRVREESFQAQTQAEDAGQEQATSKANGSQQPPNQQDGQTQLGNTQWPAGQGLNGGGFGFEGMNNGFPNMALNNPADFNTMMQFMPTNAMGGFPNMMGMPGMPSMGMDQMQAMSQSMFGGYGGPGMGMNGMNAGMGYPAAQGWNGGFNGQPGAWMSGQDKFNQNAYGGHANGMGGDFGGNAGYAGYNMPSHQGNFNQMNHHQFPNHDFQNGYHGQGFSNRGRGRGRGYAYAPRGRGGYNQVMHGNQTNHEAFHHQIPQHSPQSTAQSPHPQQTSDEGKQSDAKNLEGHKGEDSNDAEATDEQMARSFAPGDADESSEGPVITGAEENQVSVTDHDEPPYSPAEAVPSAMEIEKPDSKDEDEEESKDQQVEEEPAPIQAFVPDEPLQEEPTHPASAVSSNAMLPPPSPAISQLSQFAPVTESSYEYSARGRGGGRRFSRGASDFRMSSRGRAGPGYLPNGHTNHVASPSQPTQAPVIPPTEPKGLGVEGAPKGPKAMRDGLPSSGLRGGRGFSIVGRASAATQARPNGEAQSRRHRSRSVSTDSDREERRRERHKRHSRKYADEDEDIEDQAGSTAHHSSHRSHRERDDDRDDEKERRSHRRSHRSHRDRSKEGESRSTRKRSRTPPESFETAAPSESTSSSRKRRDRDEDEEARRERKRSRRERHVEEEDHHPSSHHLKRHNSHASSTASRAPPTAPSGPKSERLHKSQAQTTEVDPHELERQARNKERLQKELQRREAMEGKGPSKRESGPKGGGSLGRRVSYKYEDELEARDGEREREGARWE